MGQGHPANLCQDRLASPFIVVRSKQLEMMSFSGFFALASILHFIHHGNKIRARNVTIPLQLITPLRELRTLKLKIKKELWCEAIPTE